MESALELTRELIARPSVTPDDAGCQALLAARLAASGFRCEAIRCGDVTNLWARRGDSAAYEDLVRAHQQVAFRTACLIAGSAADAEEAAQDGFVKAFTHIGSYKDELPFEVWFTRILINGCLDRLKARKRRDRWIASPTVDSSGVERNPADYLPSRAPSPEDEVLAGERRRQLNGALTKLPERSSVHFTGRPSARAPCSRQAYSG